MAATIRRICNIAGQREKYTGKNGWLTLSAGSSFSPPMGLHWKKHTNISMICGYMPSTPVIALSCHEKYSLLNNALLRKQVSEYL
jgi:hypothetical protein